jgi:hypothetical protein
MSPEPLAFEVTLAVVSLVSKLMQSRQIEKSTIRSSQSAHVEMQYAAVHTGKHSTAQCTHSVRELFYVAIGAFLQK